jgi:hypothetical protein
MVLSERRKTCDQLNMSCISEKQSEAGAKYQALWVTYDLATGTYLVFLTARVTRFGRSVNNLYYEWARICLQGVANAFETMGKTFSISCKFGK